MAGTTVYDRKKKRGLENTTTFSVVKHFFRSQVQLLPDAQLPKVISSTLYSYLLPFSDSTRSFSCSSEKTRSQFLNSCT